MTNKEFFIHRWNDESKITAKAVRALPADASKWDYKPNPLTRSAREIIEHVLPHAEDLCGATETLVINEHEKHFNNAEEAASYFEKWAGMLGDKLNAIDDKTWDEQIVPMVSHGNKVFEAPMTNMFWIYIFEMTHHRGQLSTYYRPMGVRNPQIYGPTAEDIAEMMAAHQN